MKKYEFTGETMMFQGHTLKRIRYLRNVRLIKRGDIGGWIESESNLSHEGICLVRDEAKVFGNAKVTGDAWIYSNAIVKDNVQIKNKANVHDNAIIGADTIVDDNTFIGGDSQIYFYAGEQYGEANVSGDSEVYGKTIIEATGIIYESNIYDSVLLGHLALIDVVCYDKNFSN